MSEQEYIPVMPSHTTVLEDLPSEVIYEVFDYLDTYEIYRIFHNLNSRFQQLLTSMNPLKVHIANISKPSFDRYYEEFLKHHTCQISSLSACHSFALDTILLPIGKLSKFTRLERLRLDDINPRNWTRVLNDLVSLPKLSSLTIDARRYFWDKHQVYHQIFRLPSLKHCVLSLSDCSRDSSDLLPIAVANFSPIENLVLNYRLRSDQLLSLLSYVPQIRRLSIGSLSPSNRRQLRKMSVTINNLAYFSTSLIDVPFEEFETFIQHLCSRLCILRLYMTSDGQYASAHRWEELISVHMPHLEVFDIECRGLLHLHLSSPTACQAFMSSFETSFWTERNWFFTHEHHRLGHRDYAVFHSTQTYRRKLYILNHNENQLRCPWRMEKILMSVRHVYLADQTAGKNGLIYCPNADKLTISKNAHVLDAWNINNIVPLSNLTKIIIDIPQLSLFSVAELLFLTPHCHTLTLHSISLEEGDSPLVDTREPSQYSSSADQVKEISIKSCTVEEVRALVNLCPRLQQLKVTLPEGQYQSVVRYLLSENDNTRQLCSLVIQSTTDIWMEKLKYIIAEVRPTGKVAIRERSFHECHLWW